ncbi:MAG: SET domain-containing protein-lysine N-methyltransferase [Gammaproteobacteria bacterium]|nr:SET domain-containing protein-lysine N-methyltransferase [Gammaproteobacteria bacterium]MBT7306660.1 SET domain-containing protein-lysine N-methyltransferase [Gammaproteobacteria bacterium]
MRQPTIYQEHHFEVQRSTIPQCGQGLFTRVPLYKGDTIGSYLGEMITDAQSEQEPYLSSHYLLWLCCDCLIVGENYTRFINHSAKPNAQFVVSTRWKKARVEVTRKILSGDEIFLDYGPGFWEATEVSCVQHDSG